MEEEILPQWSADEDDEALLKEASECGTTQHEELKERASASGAKRTLELTDTDPSDLSKERKKRSRDEARIYPVYLIPRDPSLVRGKDLPLHAAADAMARALITEWSITDLKVIHRGAEDTAIKNSFKVAVNEEELARRLYSEKTTKSIMVKHKDYKGVETDIPYVCTLHQGAHTQGARKRKDHCRGVCRCGDYKIDKSDITQALEDIGLVITSGNPNEVHQPAMGPTCPLRSNKMITRVTPPGHTSLWRAACSRCATQHTHFDGQRTSWSRFISTARTSRTESNFDTKCTEMAC